jgi:dTDP-4-amino-4,6-dideoxygalactose transaminase
MSKDAWKRYSAAGSWYYEVLEAGYKYNMTDVQAGLGIHQLRRLDEFTRRRQEIAKHYTDAFRSLAGFRLPKERADRNHCYHLYVIQLDPEEAGVNRGDFIQALTKANIGTSVHFVPLHRHPFYQQRFGYRPEHFPVAEKMYRGFVSLPLYPKMTDSDVRDVIQAVRGVVNKRSPRTVIAVTMNASG